MTPAERRKASTTASFPTRAPVWARAARAAAALRPTLSTTTGLPLARAFRHAARNAAGSAKLSANTAMTAVLSSSARKSTTSARLTSISLPVLTAKLRPIANERAMLISCTVMLPLCETTPIEPGGNGSPGGNGLSAIRSMTLTKPSAFGPSTTIS